MAGRAPSRPPEFYRHRTASFSSGAVNKNKDAAQQIGRKEAQTAQKGRIPSNGVLSALRSLRSFAAKNPEVLSTDFWDLHRFYAGGNPSEF